MIKSNITWSHFPRHQTLRSYSLRKFKSFTWTKTRPFNTPRCLANWESMVFTVTEIHKYIKNAQMRMCCVLSKEYWERNHSLTSLKHRWCPNKKHNTSKWTVNSNCTMIYWQMRSPDLQILHSSNPKLIKLKNKMPSYVIECTPIKRDITA